MGITHFSLLWRELDVTLERSVPLLIFPGMPKAIAISLFLKQAGDLFPTIFFQAWNARAGKGFVFFLFVWLMAVHSFTWHVPRCTVWNMRICGVFLVHVLLFIGLFLPLFAHEAARPVYPRRVGSTSPSYFTVWQVLEKLTSPSEMQICFNISNLMNDCGGVTKYV